MKLLRLLTLLTGLWLGLPAARAAETNLNTHLEPFRPFLEKTWRGPFKNSKPEQPTVDVARWERALNGQAVRVLHSVNDGAYGGETLITWDAGRQSLVYHYFTTAGFSTTGTMRFEGGRVHAHETVTGDAGGVTEVRSTSELRPDGVLAVKAEYLKNGVWTLGHEADYVVNAEARIVFR